MGRYAAKLETGAVAWVTGAGKGIGRALAQELARQGMVVAISARSREDLNAMAAEDDRLRPYPLDVTDDAAVIETADSIRRDLGPVALAVFNAGTHTPVHAAQLTVAPFRRLMEVNVMGVVHGLAAVVPAMTASRSGHIAIMGSVSAYRGLPTAAAYGATKAALNNMAEAMTPELEQYGVGVTIINPGFVRTPLTDRNDFPMPFLVEPETAARTIVRGLRRGRYEISFPFSMSVLMKLIRLWPKWLYFMLMRRIVPRRKGNAE